MCTYICRSSQDPSPFQKFKNVRICLLNPVGAFFFFLLLLYSTYGVQAIYLLPCSCIVLLRLEANSRDLMPGTFVQFQIFEDWKRERPVTCRGNIVSVIISGPVKCGKHQKQNMTRMWKDRWQYRIDNWYLIWYIICRDARWWRIYLTAFFPLQQDEQGLGAEKCYVFKGLECWS